MSKSTGKKGTVKGRASASKEELTSSSGHDDDAVAGTSGRVSRQHVELQANAMTKVEASENKSGLKRNYDDDDDDDDDDQDVVYGTEMNNMLKMFGSDMTKVIHAKKKRMESYSVGYMKANLKLVVEPWGNQLKTHVETARDMYKLITSVLDQTDTEIAQMKEQDEKIIKIFQQQMKANAQNRNLMTQRVAACRQLIESFMTKAKEQDIKHREELSTVQHDLKKELSALQKKMLNEGQKEEMENVKKNLTKMFYMPTS